MKRIILLMSSFIISTFCFLRAQDTNKVCSPTVIKEIENNSSLNVFPNPTNGTFQIVYASATDCPPIGWGGLLVINIINSNGKTVYTENIPDFEGEYSRTIDLSAEQRGIYIIEVISGSLKTVRRELLN